MTMSYTGSDGYSILYKKEGESSFSTYMGAVSITTNMKVYVKLSDGVNSSSERTETIDWIDTAAPVISDLASSSTTTKGFTLGANVNETQSGIKSVTWYVGLSRRSLYFYGRIRIY